MTSGNEMGDFTGLSFAYRLYRNRCITIFNPEALIRAGFHRLAVVLPVDRPR